MIVSSIFISNMATRKEKSMAIKEPSFRIGSGRYIQDDGLISSIGTEIIRHASSPLVIGGATALSITRDSISNSIGNHCNKYEIIEHRGTCNENDAERIADYALSNNFDLIVGVGGGVIMDFAKLTAARAHLGVVNVPTSIATCAAFTPLSVKYTEEGRTVGTEHFECEVNAVVADTAVLRRQPKRLVLSGVFDAIAKHTEITHRYDPTLPIGSSPLGLSYASTLARSTRDLLMNETDGALSDMSLDYTTDRFSEIVFATVAVTGVISGIARGSNQTALAHKFYEITRQLFPVESRPYLHGEIVGVGLLLQNHYNGTLSDNDIITSLMHKYSMPASINVFGVPMDNETLMEYEYRISHSSAMSPDDKVAVAKLHDALKYLWSVK